MAEQQVTCTDTEMQPLSLAVANFEQLRNGNMIYVDKSDVIYNILDKYRCVFLSRPRRFGKSLLVSTFASLFEHGMQYFHGLKIEKLWEKRPLWNIEGVNSKTSNQGQSQFRVVRLDLSAIKDNTNIQDMKTAFDALLIKAFKKAGFVYDPTSYDSCIGQIDGWLSEQPSGLGNIVLLVDEYDAPLNSHLNDDKFFDDIRAMMSSFFIRVKMYGEAFKFVFLTGIAKFNKASIFSTLNQITDISLDVDIAPILGYTEEELREYFTPYLKRCADARHETVDEMMPKMKTMYDGFCFDEEASIQLYAPWSVLTYLNGGKGRLTNYWIDSAGRPAIITNWLKAGNILSPEKFNQPVLILVDRLKETYDVAMSKATVSILLLFQAGYLTIKKIQSNSMAVLGFPNREVYQSMADLYSEDLLGDRTIADLGYYVDIAQILADGDVDAVAEMFNVFFSGISYERYAIKNEAVVQACAQMLLSGLKFDVRVERHNFKGRSDLEVVCGTTHWVFEFKYSQTGDEADMQAKLNDGVAQMHDKQYGTPPLAKNVIKMVLVFNGVERQFGKYATV